MGLKKRTAEKSEKPLRVDDPSSQSKMDDVTVGRDLLEAQRRENEAMADTLVEGQPVQFYDSGWRYGHIDKVPEADEPKYGQVRIIHAQTGRVWVAARDVRKI